MSALITSSTTFDVTLPSPKNLKYLEYTHKWRSGYSPNFYHGPFKIFGHIATLSFMVQLWRETEPFGLTLKPAHNISWVPHPLFQGDKPITELAAQAYNARGSLMINQCRIFLQIILIGVLLLFNSNVIHPSYIEGNIPPSRYLLLLWPEAGRPPKNYWKLWASFLHVIHYLSQLHIHWAPNPPFRFTPRFYKHSETKHFYCYEGSPITEFPMSTHSRSSQTVIYSNTPNICDLVFSPARFRPVDTHYTTQGIQIVGSFPLTNYTPLDPHIPSSLQEAFQDLPASLQHICGNVPFPQQD